MTDAASGSFLARNEFLLRRLHSLSGLIPVGAYMCIHLLTNATVLDSPATFQKSVYMIHGIPMLWIVEWTFIFIPILFHAIFGVVIIRSGLPNTGQYNYVSNIRYTLQRATGMIAFLFIMWHVFHMHGWFHQEQYVENVVKPLGGGNFKPYNASSSASAAMQSPIVIILYVIGVSSCVFHLANGIWTMGITWGVWITPKAQQRASIASAIFGVALLIVGLSAIWGMKTLDRDKAKEMEDRAYKARVESGEVLPNEHKRSHEAPQTTQATEAGKTK